MTARRGFVLVLVLLMLVLVTALILPLAAMSGERAVLANVRMVALRHRLAAESLPALLGPVLDKDLRLRERLDRENLVHWDLDVGDVHLDVELQEDSGKLPLNLNMPAYVNWRMEALRVLAARAGLPALSIAQPSADLASDSAQQGASSITCLDDAFIDATDSEMFGMDGSAGWARYVTPVGSAVRAKRASLAVLEGLFADLGPEVAGRIARELHDGRSLDLQARNLSDVARHMVTERLSESAPRYSLLVRSRTGEDERCRYMIVVPGEPPAVMANWEVAP